MHTCSQTVRRLCSATREREHPWKDARWIGGRINQFVTRAGLCSPRGPLTLGKLRQDLQRERAMSMRAAAGVASRPDGCTLLQNRGPIPLSSIRAPMEGGHVGRPLTGGVQDKDEVPPLPRHRAEERFISSIDGTTKLERDREE
jgi:hypothetical protein